MIKQLLNSVMAKYRDLSVSGSRQIIDLLVTDKSRSFAQPRPIIVNCRFVSLLDCISLVSKINYSSRSAFLISFVYFLCGIIYGVVIPLVRGEQNVKSLVQSAAYL